MKTELKTEIPMSEKLTKKYITTIEDIYARVRDQFTKCLTPVTEQVDKWLSENSKANIYVCSVNHHAMAGEILSVINETITRYINSNIPNCVISRPGEQLETYVNASQGPVVLSTCKTRTITLRELTNYAKDVVDDPESVVELFIDATGLLDLRELARCKYILDSADSLIKLAVSGNDPIAIRKRIDEHLKLENESKLIYSDKVVFS